MGDVGGQKSEGERERESERETSGLSSLLSDLPSPPLAFRVTQGLVPLSLASDPSQHTPFPGANQIRRRHYQGLSPSPCGIRATIESWRCRGPSRATSMLCAWGLSGEIVISRDSVGCPVCWETMKALAKLVLLCVTAGKPPILAPNEAPSWGYTAAAFTGMVPQKHANMAQN